VVTKFKPASEFNLSYLYGAVRLPCVMKNSADQLYTNLDLAAGGTLADVLTAAPDPDGQVIRVPEKSFAEGGCFAILRGNLAPQGAVVKKNRHRAIHVQAHRAGGGFRLRGRCAKTPSQSKG
jgi:dihydroxy-acid dehydratase